MTKTLHLIHFTEFYICLKIIPPFEIIIYAQDKIVIENISAFALVEKSGYNLMRFLNQKIRFIYTWVVDFCSFVNISPIVIVLCLQIHLVCAV
jgi:hypothetical protein